MTIKTVLKGHIKDFLLILYKKRPKNEQEGTKYEWKWTKKALKKYFKTAVFCPFFEI